MGDTEFGELSDFVSNDGLRLPVNGKLYHVRDVDAETGLWVQSLFDGAAKLTDEEAEGLYRRCLGATWDELHADGVGWSQLKRIGLVTTVWIARGKKSAKVFWELPDGAEDDDEGEAEPGTTPGNSASLQASAAAVSTSTANGTTTKVSRPRKTRASRGPTSSVSGAS